MGGSNLENCLHQEGYLWMTQILTDAIDKIYLVGVDSNPACASRKPWKVVTKIIALNSSITLVNSFSG